jgi:outer membrane protein OmpA-like peptidoglycan-associated protein
MAGTLVNLITGQLTPDVMQKAAALIGESGAATQKAFAGIVPTLVGALVNQASTMEGADQLARTLGSGKFDASALGGVASMFSGGPTTQDVMTAGKGLLEMLFGVKLGDVVAQLARFAGIRMDSASSLLALAGPLVLSVLGRERASIGQSGASLRSLLGAQRSSLDGLIPAGLASLLGWGSVTPGVSQVTSAMSGSAACRTEGVAPAPRALDRRSWVPPLVALGALVLSGLIWLSWPTTSVREAARKLSELQLPGGVKISVPEGSFNFSLASWLATPASAGVPKRFVFDDLNFETASTRLTPESVGTVDTLVAVLRAYPGVTVDLEGHTDSTGDPAANKKLSLDRAMAVKDMLVKGGVSESRITSAVGHGQEKPIALNDSEAGRAKNRRLELVVLKR